MDTLFATLKGVKLSQGNTCCQLFVTGKSYIYIVPMKCKSEVLHAIKQFSKEIGMMNVIVCDMAGEQMSPELKQFCNTIGTTLWALEEGTPWANKVSFT